MLELETLTSHGINGRLSAVEGDIRKPLAGIMSCLKKEVCGAAGVLNVSNFLLPFNHQHESCRFCEGWRLHVEGCGSYRLICCVDPMPSLLDQIKSLAADAGAQ